MKFEAARSMITHVTFTRFMSDSRLSSSFSCSSPTRSALHSTTTEAAAAAAALPLPFTSLRPSQPNRSSYRGGQYYSLEVPCFAPLSCVFMHVFTTAAFFDTKTKFGHFCVFVVQLIRRLTQAYISCTTMACLFFFQVLAM